MEWLVNGQPGRAVDVADRGLAYGDGLFETIAVREGTPRFFERHMARLVAGCRRLAIPEPSGRRLGDQILQLAAGRRGTAKIVVTRGRGARGYGFAAEIEPTQIVGFTEEPVPAGAPAGGIHVTICRTPASVNAALAGLKTLNRLDNVLASAEWRDKALHEGLMCDAEGGLIGGTMSNLFLVRGERLQTPSLERSGVRGIMRGVVVEVASAAGIEVAEARLTTQDLAEGEELFLTNALIGIWPVVRCDDRTYRVGSITSAIADALLARGVTECRP